MVLDRWDTVLMACFIKATFPHERFHRTTLVFVNTAPLPNTASQGRSTLIILALTKNQNFGDPSLTGNVNLARGKILRRVPSRRGHRSGQARWEGLKGYCGAGLVTGPKSSLGGRSPRLTLQSTSRLCVGTIIYFILFICLITSGLRTH